jgi:menaquinone-dependent protoporphyrinogen oxidase
MILKTLKTITIFIIFFFSGCSGGVDYETISFSKGDDMENIILVAYGSKSGSTAEIAEFMASELVKKGFAVDLKPAKDVESVDEYKTVIVGGPIWAGSWPGPVTDFIKNNKDTLKEKKVAYFLTCLSLTEDKEESRKAEEKYLEKERAMVEPISEGRFAGKMDSSKLNFFFKIMMKMMKAKDADHRDWEKIKEWVSEVAER